MENENNQQEEKIELEPQRESQELNLELSNMVKKHALWISEDAKEIFKKKQKEKGYRNHDQLIRDLLGM